MNSKKKFKMVALGCRTNQYEAQAFQDQLSHMGYEAAKEGEAAELCIVNTCTVTASADSSSRHEIRQLAKNHPGARIVVTGCYAERDVDAVKSIAGVTDVVANKDKESLLNLIMPEEDIPEFSIKHFDAHTRAFVKVQDGCNSFCTYCIIPYVRGRSRSRPLDSILNEVKQLVDNGFREIVLTGINIGDYDGACDPPVRLAQLVKAVDNISGVDRIRVSSIDPDEVDDELASAILYGKHTCPSMHIVLQSGSNLVLKRMNRKYTRQIFIDTVERLRRANPDFTFTTDIIVGFPGETEDDFQETLDVMAKVRFAKVHMFPYSDRPRTRAALYPNKVAPDVMMRRKQEVLRLSEQSAYALRQEYLHRRMWVLTESKDMEHPGEIQGHTDNFLNVRIQDSSLIPNQLVEVEMVANSELGLIGKVVD